MYIYRRDANQGCGKFGDSKHLAKKRLNQLFRRLSKAKTTKVLYQQCMQEY